MVFMAKILNVIRLFLLGISAVFFVTCIVLVTANVIGRAAFNSPIEGVYEMVGLCVVTFGSSALVTCAIQEGHIKVDIVTEKLKKLPKLGLSYFAYLLDILYYGVFSYCLYTYGYTKILSKEASESLKIPIAPFRLWMAFCITLIVLVKLYQAFKEKQKIEGLETEKKLDRTEKMVKKMEADAEVER